MAVQTDDSFGQTVSTLYDPQTVTENNQQRKRPLQNTHSNDVPWAVMFSNS